MTAESKRITQLEKENQRLQQQLLVKDQCLELQKKALSLIDAFDLESRT